MKDQKAADQPAGIQAMRGFFERLAAEQQDRQSSDFQSFENQWAVFGPAFSALLKQSNLEERRTASKYNIFRVLKVEHDEEKTHSRFLADLLDPSGFHGQGVAFLRALLDHFHSNQGLPLLNADFFKLPWYVDTEKGTPHGRIDIVIACPQAKYLVVIENKVFAVEQERQINRYHAWLQGQSHTYSDRHLLFLTPDGREPLTAQGCHCVCISYRDLATILREVSIQIAAAGLRATIEQYMDVIENFQTDGELPYE